MNTYIRTNREYAAIYNCTIRSITRYRERQLPLDDFDAMERILNCQVNRPNPHEVYKPPVLNNVKKPPKPVKVKPEKPEVDKAQPKPHKAHKPTGKKRGRPRKVRDPENAASENPPPKAYTPPDDSDDEPEIDYDPWHGVEDEKIDQAEAKRRKTIVEYKKLKLTYEIQAGLYTANDKITSDWFAIGAAVGAALTQLHADLPGLILGLDAISMSRMIEKETNKIRKLLSDLQGKFYGNQLTETAAD